MKKLRLIAAILLGHSVMYRIGRPARHHYVVDCTLTTKFTMS